MSVAFSIQLLVLAIITVLYASFDLFNDRNVPDVFAYASIAIGVAMTLAFDSGGAAYSFAIALIVGALGYAIYRMGLWGAGDFFALVAISLLLPVQPQPLLVAVGQFGLPFVLSVFIATGLVAVWVVPPYYLIFKKKTDWESKVNVRHVFMGVTLAALYAALLLMVYYLYGFALESIALIILVAVPSVIILVFEEKITARMIQPTPLGRLAEGDMIATGLMGKVDVKRLSRKYRSFGKLVTGKLAIEAQGAKDEVLAYSSAAPLAAFMLAGVVIALLFGNVVLLMLV